MSEHRLAIRGTEQLIVPRAMAHAYARLGYVLTDCTEGAPEDFDKNPEPEVTRVRRAPRKSEAT